MSGVSIPIQAQFDSGELDKALATLTGQINKLGDVVAGANKVKFNPIDKAALADIDRVKAQFESLNKISADFKKRLKGTGQEKADFFDIDWSKMYVDPKVRARQMRKAYEYVTDGTGAHFQDLPGPGGKFGTDDIASKREWDRRNGGGGRGGGGGGGGGAANDDEDRPDRSWKRKIVSSGLRAAGPAGGVADDAISTGLTSGATAGLMGLAGGLVALGVGKLMSSVVQKVGSAEQENVGYDSLKRQIGDVNVSFEVLKGSLRAASDGLAITYEEGQKLGAEFVKLSGATADNYKQLAEEVKTAGGFGRSFGLDPAQSTAFFAQMRNAQVTNNHTETQQLALVVGEAIAKSGAFAKADEMLQAISSYTTQQTRLGLATANVGDYAGMLTGLVASKTPGLDPEGASSLLSRVNSSIAHGGSAGEAGKNFLYSTVGKPLDLNPIQTSILLEQGAFGTGAGTFGPGTLGSKWMSEHNVGLSGAARNDNTTTLEKVLANIRRQYSGSPEKYQLGLNAGGNLLGINTSAMMALDSIAPKDLHGLVNRFQKIGVDNSQLNPTNISAMAQIEADGSLSDAEKDKRIKEIAPQSQEKTLGSDVRDSKALLSNLLTQIADRAVPLLTDMRAGILYMAGDKGAIGPAAIARAVAEGQHRENVSAIQSKFTTSPDLAKARKAQLDLKMHDFDLGRIINDPRSSPAEVAKATAERAKLESSNVDAIIEIGKLEKDRADALAKEKVAYEASLDSIKAAQESASQTVTPGTSTAPAPGAPAGATASNGASSGGSGNHEEFLAKYDPYADKIAKGTGIDKKLILAQLAVETGWGKKEIAGTNNPFNVHASKGWNGATVQAPDKDADGKPYMASFRAYGSLMGESADEQIAMYKRRYPGVINAGSDAHKFTSNLKGYAENRQYGELIESVAKSLNGKQMTGDAATVAKAKAADDKSAQPASTQKVQVEVTHTHEKPDGSPMPGVQSVNTAVYAPVAYGDRH
jgi:flagellum-specific peptidoglycan hydrolase FlgJ